MADQEFQYDVFLSYTEVNKSHAAKLFERLRNEGARVFFAEETMPAGSNVPLELMDALKASRKVALIMTPAYFAKTWPRAEFASILSKDPENKERRILPLLFEKAEIPDLISPLKFIDFTNDDDFDLRLHKLVEALELQRNDFRFVDREEIRFREHKLEPTERGRRNYEVGKRFEDEVGEGPKLSELETDLYRELRQRSGAEVVYLQEFDDGQIQEYLKKARPLKFAEDWQKIQRIHNLKDLATRPL